MSAMASGGGPVRLLFQLGEIVLKDLDNILYLQHCATVWQAVEITTCGSLKRLNR